jgi:haloalkane dehalogenase
MLERLANEAPRALGNKPMELVWAMKDPAFGSQAVIARWQRDFPSANLTRVPQANHYIQEDAPEAIATAVDRVEARLLKRER